jgi:hypothetical protein
MYVQVRTIFWTAVCGKVSCTWGWTWHQQLDAAELWDLSLVFRSFLWKDWNVTKLPGISQTCEIDRNNGKKQRSEVHMPISVLRNKNELPQKRKECTDCKQDRKTGCCGYRAVSFTHNCTQRSVAKVNSLRWGHDCGSTQQIGWWSDSGESGVYNGEVHPWCINFNAACYAVRLQALCDFLMGLGTPMNLICVITVCLIETHSTVSRASLLMYRDTAINNTGRPEWNTSAFRVQC